MQNDVYSKMQPKILTTSTYSTRTQKDLFYTQTSEAG